MNNDTQAEQMAFEKWARQNVGQFSPAGYHGTGGVWFYRHNIQQLMWVCWRASANTRTTSLAAQDGLVDAKELRRIASIFKQWRSTLMLNKMDGEQWRSLNKAFDDLEALSAIKGNKS